MQETINNLRKNDDWLLARAMRLATVPAAGASGAIGEAFWRQSILGLNRSLAEGLQSGSGSAEEGWDESNEGPLSRLGQMEAQRCFKQGVSLAAYLGQMRCFRQSYLDYLSEKRPDGEPGARPLLERGFDRIEIAFCRAWAELTAGQDPVAPSASGRESGRENGGYLTVFESLTDPAILVDGTLRIVHLNHAAALLADRTRLPDGEGDPAGAHDPREVAVGRTRREALAGRELVQLYPWLAGLVHGSEGWIASQGGQADYQATIAGRTHYFEATWSALPGNAKQDPGFVLLLRDITRGKGVEADLKNRETALQSIFRAVPVGIGLVVNRVLQQVNDRICEISGYRREELLGQSSRMLYPTQEEFEQVGRDKYRQIAEKGTGTVETRWRHKEGRTVEVLLSSTPLDVQDLTRGVTFSVMDITEQKRIMRELQGVLAALSATNRELDQFSYSVSHDLKNPLITIKGMTDWIKRSIAAGQYETLADDFAFIDRACRQMEQLLDGLLQLSRLGRTVGETVAVDMTEVVQEALELCQGRLKQRGVAVIAGPLTVVRGDPLRLRQVWENLIGNAVKFMGDQPDPRIEIGMASGNAQGVAFYIRDNGLGIDRRHIEKIFESFSRLNSEIEGSGLGLSMVRRIIQAHQGRIWVESPGPGLGSVFYFTLGETGG